MIFLPPREHDPPHVHVRNSDGEVVIELARPDQGQVIRSAAGMKTADVVRAFRLVEERTEFLLDHWRRYHG
ncbi:MAG: DUF4160 domain-containing protein [Gemmatimonadaceae bacterium]|nr:DUF4160 domain-containing protein [Gemmatimonadaceae bacterium]